MTDQHQPEAQPAAQPDLQSVEQVVRSQLSKALGGRRGMVEAAVPTILFTLIWLTVRDLPTALVVGVAAALLMLVVRLVQRSSVQFVVNALFGIGIGWLFVALAARAAPAGTSRPSPTSCPASSTTAVTPS